MPLFHLEPVSGSESHEFWQMSLIGAIPCFVVAGAEAEARQRVHDLTVELASTAAGSPWLDPKLSRCTALGPDQEPPFAVEENQVVDSNGRVLADDR